MSPLKRRRWTRTYSRIAEALYPDKSLTFKQLLAEAGVSRRALARCLRRLVEKGLVVKEVKSRKQVYYRLPDPYFAALIEKFSAPFFRKLLSLEEYAAFMNKAGESDTEADASLKLFFGLAWSNPRARIIYEPGSIYLYPLGDGDKVELELKDISPVDLPLRLTLGQCLDRWLTHFNLMALTEEELTRLGVEFQKDKFGIYFGRIGLEKISKIKEGRRIFMEVLRPRNETINKISTLIYVTYMNKARLVKYAKIKPIIV